MRRSHIGAALTTLVILAAGACEDPLELEPPFTLIFEGDRSFQDPHGSQNLRVAVVSVATDQIVAQDQDTVSSVGTRAFTFVWEDLMDDGVSYQIHYWIDSNFDDGRVDVCDEIVDDHQWWFEFGPVRQNLRVSDQHRPTEVADVCTTFTADLTFQGDASFQVPHGGQTIHAAVVRSGDGTVLWTRQGTVSSSEDPSFAFQFPGALLYEDSFEIHYWIDSNFGGGTQGTCDPPANDHQWAVTVGQPDAPAVLVEDTHRPTETESVCSTFQ